MVTSSKDFVANGSLPAQNVVVICKAVNWPLSNLIALKKTKDIYRFGVKTADHTDEGTEGKIICLPLSALSWVALERPVATFCGKNSKHEQKCRFFA